MNRKKIISLFLTLASFSASGNDGLIWNKTENPRFRIPNAFEFETTNKLTYSYVSLLRQIDEFNRLKKNNIKPYINDYYGNIPKYPEDVDIVPIWLEHGKGEDWGADFTYNKDKVKYYTPEKIRKDIAKDNLEDYTYRFVNSGVRFYFGNGNNVKNLIIKDKKEFETAVTNIRKKKNERLFLDGEYKMYNNGAKGLYNPLNITEKEYNENFLDSHGNKVSGNNEKLIKFLEKRMNEKGLKVFAKNGELYTFTDGKEHRVIWNAYPMSDKGTTNYKTNKKEYKNTLMTRILFYKKYDNDKGRSVYTKDGTIILEDTLDYDGRNLKIKDLSPKKFREKMLIDFKNVRTGDITEAEFKKRWDISKNDVNYHNILSKVDTLQTKLNNLNKYLDPTIWTSDERQLYFVNKVKELDKKRGGSSSVEDDVLDSYIKGYSWKISPAKVLEKYKNDPEVMAIINEANNMKKDKNSINNKINSELKDYKRVSIVDALSYTKKGKYVRFGGKGRIDGILDLGNGYNVIEINEDTMLYTGKYGTNITLGSNAQLKNINLIKVGRQHNATVGGSGLSGITSLTMEIDPNKFNREGHLYKHALKDTWTKDNKLVFMGTDRNNINDFLIEFKVSDINKDNVIINMGRPLDYTYRGYSHKIKLYSDSIAHNLIRLKDKKNGESLVKVHIKDNLKRLNNTENQIFKSMKESGGLGHLKNTFTTTNKKTTFASPNSDRIEKEKNINLTKYILSKKTSSEILKEISQLELDQHSTNELIKKIDTLKESSKIISAKEKLENLKKYRELNLNNISNEISAMVLSLPEISGGSDSQQKKYLAKIYDTPKKLESQMKYLQSFIKENLVKFNKDLIALEPKNNDIAQARSIRNDLKYNIIPLINSNDYNIDNLHKLISSLKKVNITLTTASSNDITYIALLKLTEDKFKEYLTKELIYESTDFQQIRTLIYYTRRQEEALNELKILTNQIYNNNIYAKVNKISKNEIDTFAPAVFDNNFGLKDKKCHATGKLISGRFSRDKFKGTIYTGFGMYEQLLNKNLSAGFVIGGANSNFHEIVNDDIRTVTTNSKIKGTSAYLGTFGRYNVNKNLSWTNGIGVQYASYDVDRNMKNHYQENTYKGNLDTYSGNIYTGLTYKYKINDTLDANLKGILSYTLIKQGKATEENKPLSMEIKSQNFNYLDSQVGIGLTKTIYGNKVTSSLSGTLYTIYGIAGYDNDDLKGKMTGANSGFNIKGESYDNQSIKLKLNYSVSYNSGFDYGLEGGYSKNSDEDNISVAIKAGFSF